MTDDHSAPGPACLAVADLLPLLASGALDAEEARRAREHAGACAWCQRRLAAYDMVDGSLRRTFANVGSPSPFASIEEIIRLAIGDDERAEMAFPSVSRRRPVVRAFSGAAAVAAVVLVAVLAQYLFAHHPRTTGRGVVAAPTATPGLSALSVYQSTIQGAGVNATGAVYSYRASDGTLLAKATTVTAAAISDGIVYGIKPGSPGQSPMLVAQRAASGVPLWSVPIDDIAAPTIVVASGVLYFSTSQEGDAQTGAPTDPTIHAVYAYRASDGARLWRHDLPKQWISPPAVATGVVYVAGEHEVWAIRASNGTALWTAPLATGGADWLGEWLTATPNALYAHVALASSDGQKDHFAAHVIALRASDGGELWDATLGDDVNAARGPYAPVVVDGVVYDRVASSDFTNPVQLHLIALRASDGGLLWNHTVTRPQEGDLGFADMKEPEVADGVVYTAEDGGWISALRASDGSVLWRRRVDYSTPTLVAYPDSVSSPVLASGYGVLFVNSDDAVVAVHAQDGATLWTRVLFATQDVAPVVGRG